MPSSGSTTSFIASVTSSMVVVPPPEPLASGTSGRSSWRAVPVAVVVGVRVLRHRFSPRSRPGGVEGLRRGVLPGHPGQQGALHARGELGDAGERDAVLEGLLVGLDGALALHQGEELLVDAHRLVDRLADHQVGQHGRRGLRDRAAERVVRHVLHHTVGQVDAQRHLVATGRVHVVHLGLVGVAQALVVGVLVVVQDDLLVQRVELGRHLSQLNLKYERVYSRPSTNASISAGVV